MTRGRERSTKFTGRSEQMVNVAWPYVAALALALILGLFLLMHLAGGMHH